MVTILYFAMVLAVLTILSLVLVQIEKDVGFGFSFKPLKIKVYSKSAGNRNNLAPRQGRADLSTASSAADSPIPAAADSRPGRAITTIANQTFAGQTIQLDGQTFQGCTFNNCTLIYAGHTPASFSQCQFTATKWQVTAAAENVIAFLEALYRNGGESGRQWVEEAVAQITQREGPGPS